MRQGEIIGGNVKRIREQRSMSINRLAQLVGVRLNTIQTIERGETQKSKYLPDIARILEVPLSEIDPSQSSNGKNPMMPRQGLIGEKDLPVYRLQELGEGLVAMSREPVDKADRPPSLAHVRDAYGVLVADHTMSPVLRPGDIAVVHPHKHPRHEDICVFRRKVEGRLQICIREFVADAKDGWKVKEYQPSARESVLRRKDWQECHVVVTIHRR